MQIIKNVDLFLDKQPEKLFTTTLCAPVHDKKPVGFGLRKATGKEIIFNKVKLYFDFPDENNLLDYAYADFKEFLRSAEIPETKDGKFIKLKRENISGDVENFILNVENEGCTIIASATEGIRRALIFIEDEMKRRSGPFLPKGKTVKKTQIHTRISRCFFTPPSHASAEGSVNELCSDIDYYPDEYLNRLAHDGINGLWIGSSFKKMLKSNIITEYGKEQDVQIKKLNQIIEKCKKFGIGIYLFVTEPASTCYSPEILNYPDMIGATTPGDNFTLLCPSTPKVQAYIKEATTKLFTLAPDLAGLINITVGESLSACSSTSRLICPRCKEKFGSLGAALAATEKMFSDAVKEVAPNAKFISWTYEHRSTLYKDLKESCRLRDKNVIQMQNFEDLGTPVQLGKKRLAYDYWLSYPGPGKLMRRTARLNKKRNITTFAKIQACSSHEISTVPYVPVPGILYDKYKFMHNNGIKGAMQCWYFGNYPSLMNKSAHELSFTSFYRSKESFLTHLAKTYFGSDYKNAVTAWKWFEKGYKNFPVNLAFEWVGPMQDSPCVPLHLIPADWPMPGTWLKSEQSGGDRIGECLLNGHTIDEAIILVGRMCEYWNIGLKYMQAIPSENNEVREEQKRNATAISLIFRSGLNTLKFYKLRHLLGTRQGGIELLEKMKNIVHEEIAGSSALLPISEKDIRIGYHSEANGYKIFPEKLKWRIEKLKELLLTEFPEVEKRLKDNELPLPFYYGLNEGSTRKIIAKDANSAEWSYFYTADGAEDKNTALKVYEDKNGCHIQIKVNSKEDTIRIKPEFNVMFPKIPLDIINGEFTIQPNNSHSVPYYKVDFEKKKFRFNSTETENEFIYTISFNRKTMGMTKDEPFRFAVWRNGKINSTLLHANKYFASQLIRGEFSPEHYCFFVKE
ncbi:MAG: hypothetical protein IKA11_01815 [Clostridia bacterium]|nr:hypothetical protein [Clostridia bacterium]